MLVNGRKKLFKKDMDRYERKMTRRVERILMLGDSFLLCKRVTGEAGIR